MACPGGLDSIKDIQILYTCYIIFHPNHLPASKPFKSMRQAKTEKRFVVRAKMREFRREAT